jgi:hypothetical protein
MRVESALIFAAAALVTGSAAAAHCSHGQFYRVKLDECVGLSSALARPFMGEAVGKTTLVVKPVRMAKRLDPGFVDGPPEGSEPAPSQSDPPDDPSAEGDNWVWFPLPPVSLAFWGSPADPPGLTLRQPESPEPGPWPLIPRQWPSQ